MAEYDAQQNYMIELRNLKLADYKDLEKSMGKAYAGIREEVWTREEIKRLLDQFPEGQICLEVNGMVVAVALSIIVNYAKYGDNHSYNRIIDNGKFGTHDPNGDVLYGIDVFVHPDYQGMRLARRLYDARKELCESLNLRSIVAGGRIPGYQEYAHEMTPKEYIEKVQNRELFDPILTFQISNNFHVKKILKNYLPTDNESKTYATLIEWNNVYFEESEKLIGLKKSVVRIGLVQWQMRRVASMEALVDQAEFFIDAVSGYNADFVVFPELFNAPLMADYNHLEMPEAIRELSNYTDSLRNKFVEFAISYNINIIAGSMPVYEGDEKLFNVSFLCRRDGSWDQQYKLHITPNEIGTWGFRGGEKVKVFDTDSGKIGILICYDVEFPELSRLMADEGMEILFVPFLTDTQNGYTRVRRCAQSRAIENECYVAVAGAVGNLPRVSNMDIQYAQSAVFSPSDFAFPTNAVVAEATPNNEMTLIADVNLDLLKELHTKGSAMNLKDRRKDIYDLKWKR
ncbi:MAG: bifunctional GNAT family N-acetyltransferase/carbon-nitrogen hydrolase family protein [Bacteroidales bacterium]|nr:bifunctional GNAT family N-acetyltransferase/carbon-nitrogen hydrolase family protein [Bacteroidales bacterium]